ncbi:MAG: ATP/GTP-binding protein, partial [Caldivirga sp.]
MGLNTAPSPHALIVGPTGSGKSWSTVSLMMRAITKYGVRVLIIDPQGEYLPYTPDIDIRDYVSARGIMRKYKLGPNASLIAAVDLII